MGRWYARSVLGDWSARVGANGRAYPVSCMAGMRSSRFMNLSQHGLCQHWTSRSRSVAGSGICHSAKEVEQDRRDATC
eukprot:677783-Rhodomonas_salina.3